MLIRHPYLISHLDIIILRIYVYMNISLYWISPYFRYTSFVYMSLGYHFIWIYVIWRSFYFYIFYLDNILLACIYVTRISMYLVQFIVLFLVTLPLYFIFINRFRTRDIAILWYVWTLPENLRKLTCRIYLEGYQVVYSGSGGAENKTTTANI